MPCNTRGYSLAVMGRIGWSRGGCRGFAKDAAPERATENGGEGEGICLGDMAEVAVHDRVGDDHRALPLVVGYEDDAPCRMSTITTSGE